MTDPHGCHRSLDPPGALPQNSWRLDNDPTPRLGETPVRVEVLNVDSSSFRQLRQQSAQEGRPLEDLIVQIVRERGKLHNPVTGSGGMLLGTLPSGERIATLVSLSLTPLLIERIRHVDLERERVQIDGQAILFEKTLYSRLPADIDESVALAAFDVAGAPAAVARLCRSVATVLILGAGKAGLLTAAAVRRENPSVRILLTDVSEEALSVARELGLCDWAATLDASQAAQVQRSVREATGGSFCDLTINLVNQPNTEGSSILATREGGMVYFFSMATSFSQAALTAEGLARDVQMMIGSGYTPGWTDYALSLLRERAGLRRHFESRYGQPRV